MVVRKSAWAKSFQDGQLCECSFVGACRAGVDAETRVEQVVGRAVCGKSGREVLYHFLLSYQVLKLSELGCGQERLGELRRRPRCAHSCPSWSSTTSSWRGT